MFTQIKGGKFLQSNKKIDEYVGERKERTRRVDLKEALRPIELI